MINARWKPLDKLVTAYNAEVNRYNQRVDPDGPVRLRPLSHRDLREVGIENADGDICDVERLLCDADWAVQSTVSSGGESKRGFGCSGLSKSERSCCSTLTEL
jgi:hypothetical protein